MARQQEKKLAAVTTGSAGSSGIPCAMVLRLIRDLPGEPGFLCPHHHAESSARLVASVGATGPHDFAVRISAVRPHEKSCATPSRPPHPRLAPRDDRACAPRVEAGWRAWNTWFGVRVKIFSENQHAYPATWWHDGQIAVSIRTRTCDAVW